MVGESADVLGLVQLARADYSSARAMGVESLVARVQLRNRATVPMSLKIVGIADAELGEPARATILFGHAEFVEETTGALPNSYGSDPYRRALATVRTALGAEQLQRHIMIKLGVNSRALIAVWVATQRMNTRTESVPRLG